MAFTVTQLNARDTPDYRAWWELKERLVDGGATVTLSSDGVTFGAGDNLTPGGPYVSQFSVTGSYFVLRWPTVDGVRREVCFQKTANLGRIRFYYSCDGIGFAGGNATVRPTAADEQLLQNDTTSMFASTSNPQDMFLNFIVGDVDEKYSWLFEVHPIGLNTVYSACFMDVVSQPSTGDQDPCVLGCGMLTGGSTYPYMYTSEFFTATTTAGTSRIVGWYKLGLSGVTWVAFPFGHPGYGAGSFGAIQPLYTHNLPPTPDGAFLVFPVIYHRGADMFATSQTGYKGISRLFRLTSEEMSGTQVVNADKTMAVQLGIVRPWASGLNDRY